MQQSTNPDWLNNKKGSKWDIWISLKRQNRIDFMGRLGAGEDLSRRDQKSGIGDWWLKGERTRRKDVSDFFEWINSY